MPTSNQTVSRLVACVLVFAGMSAADAQETAWQVAKSSGEVWITNSGAQPASLGSDTRLKPGDNIRTGRNGRVLLTRGEERILVSPNSAIGVPFDKNSDLPTTITQQAGTILLDVEKRNVRHFEVETPYLAAIVKGTQFRVSVEKGRSRVEVLRGQVQVADFKSGQNVLVLPGQAARTSTGAAGGLQLSGKGRFNAIEQGAPRQSTLRAMSVPRGGLRAPASRAGEHTRALKAPSRAFASATPGQQLGNGKTYNGGLRIGSTLGEVKLDIHKVTNGLARGGSEARIHNGKSSDGQGRGARGDNRSALSLADSGTGLGGPNGRGNGGGFTAMNANGAGNGNGAANGNAGGNGGGNGQSNGQGSGNGGGNAGGNGKGKGKGN
jgi:hypothetical protein